MLYGPSFWFPLKIKGKEKVNVCKSLNSPVVVLISDCEDCFGPDSVTVSTVVGLIQ